MMDNKVMHKRKLVDEVARRSGPWGLTRREVREALHGILDVITDEMADGNAVTIAGFGRFEAKEHKGRRVVGFGVASTATSLWKEGSGRSHEGKVTNPSKGGTIAPTLRGQEAKAR